MSAMIARQTVLITAAVLVGLGLGASVLRGAVPVSQAQTVSTQSSVKPASQPTAPALNEASARLQNEANTISIVRKYEPGLVYISTEQTVQTDPLGSMFGGGGSQVQQGVGSGFFVNAAGDILTNFHVVQGADKIQIRVFGSSQSFAAKVIGRAPQYDLALIRPTNLPAKLIRPIPLGDSDTLAVGQKAVAMGAPFGLDFSVTEGIVSATNRRIPIGFSVNGGSEGITQNAIQTDAAINPGNSGGPLLNSAGQVIGINTQIISPASSGGEGQNAGVGFAIPINAAKNLLPRLQKAGGKAVYAPRLGISAGLLALQSTQDGQTQPVPMGLGALTQSARSELGLPAQGVVVASVSKDSPAARAGIVGGSKVRQFQGGQISLGGDVITRIGGQQVDSLEDLQAGLIGQEGGRQRDPDAGARRQDPHGEGDARRGGLPAGQLSSVQGWRATCHNAGRDVRIAAESARPRPDGLGSSASARTAAFRASARTGWATGAGGPGGRSGARRAAGRGQRVARSGPTRSGLRGVGKRCPGAGDGAGPALRVAPGLRQRHTEPARRNACRSGSRPPRNLPHGGWATPAAAGHAGRRSGPPRLLAECAGAGTPAGRGKAAPGRSGCTERSSGENTLRPLHAASFHDDASRLVRGARLAARLGLHAHPALLAQVPAALEVATRTPRLNAELKLLLHEARPGKAARVLTDWGAGALVPPGTAKLLERLDAQEQPDPLLASALLLSAADDPDALAASLKLGERPAALLARARSERPFPAGSQEHRLRESAEADAAV